MNRMLILYIFLLLCGTVSAQQTVEWNDLQPLTDDAHRTVYYKKDSKLEKPLNFDPFGHARFAHLFVLYD